MRAMSELESFNFLNKKSINTSSADHGEYY